MPRKRNEVLFRNFSGGPNVRDAASELQQDEFSDSLNVTLDSRGYVMSRLGFVDRYNAQIGTGLVSTAFYWPSKDQYVFQIGTGTHKENNSSFKTWSTSDRIGMCEFAGFLVMVHPVDGLFLYDGTTVTGPFTNGPKGNTCAAWQNKVFVGGDPNNPPRIAWSNAGAAGTWTSNAWVEIRDKDSNIITCLAGASGQDITGRPGLLAFKADSAYRINDPATGSYTTIDPSIGCGSNIGAVSAYGRTYVISSRGIYSTDGVESLKEESRLWSPLFNKTVINQTRPDLFCAGRREDHLFFSLPSVGDTFNSIALEFDPEAGWIVRHSNAASAYAFSGRTATDMIFASPTLNGRIYNDAQGGTDNGADISSMFVSRWIEPNEGLLVRVRRARYVGLGAFQANILQDFNKDSTLAAHNVNILPGASFYDSGALYDAPTSLYGPTAFQSKQDFWSIGTARAIAVKITATTNTTLSGKNIAGIPIAQGAWMLAYSSVQAIDLGTY